MVNITHQIGVAASPMTVMQALTTIKGGSSGKSVGK